MADEIYKLNPIADRYQLLIKTCYDPVGAVSIKMGREKEVHKDRLAATSAQNSLNQTEFQSTNPYKKCLYCYEPLLDSLHHEACARFITEESFIPVVNLTEAVVKELEKINLQNHVSIQGVQHKISLDQVGRGKKSRLTVTDYAGGYILKPRGTIPHLPENEHLVLMLAKEFGIQTAKSALVLLENGGLALLSKRFDRVNKEKCHVEDFGQILDQVASKKYISSLEKVGKALTLYCSFSAPKEQLLRLFELVIFSYVVGNSDLHLKNISVLLNPEPQLAPAYDLLSFEIYQEDFKEKDPDQSALAINGKKAKLGKQDFDALADSFGLSIKVRDYVYKKIKSKKSSFELLIEKSFLSVSKQEALKSLISERLARF